jgi:hypothetical protein
MSSPALDRYGRYTLAALDTQVRASLPDLDAAEGPQDAPKVLRGHEIQDSRLLLHVSREVDSFVAGLIG